MRPETSQSLLLAEMLGNPTGCSCVCNVLFSVAVLLGLAPGFFCSNGQFLLSDMAVLVPGPSQPALPCQAGLHCSGSPFRKPGSFPGWSCVTEPFSDLALALVHLPWL